jgi:hypothetical protein
LLSHYSQAQSNGGSRGGGGLFFFGSNKSNNSMGIAVDLLGHKDYQSTTDIVNEHDQEVFTHLQKAMKSPEFLEFHKIKFALNFLDSYKLINERIEYWQPSSPVVTDIIFKSLTATMYWIVTDLPLELQAKQTDWLITEAYQAQGQAEVAVQFDTGKSPLVAAPLLFRAGIYSLAALRVHEAFRNMQLNKGFDDFTSEKIQKLTADFLLGKIDTLGTLDDPKYFDNSSLQKAVGKQIQSRDAQFKLFSFICGIDATKVVTTQARLLLLQNTLCPSTREKFDRELVIVAPYYIEFLLYEPLAEVLKHFKNAKRDHIYFSPEETRFLIYLTEEYRFRSGSYVAPTLDQLQDAVQILQTE